MLPAMDPLAFLPYALAAAGGRLGTYQAAQLVAAGTTLLQRSAPLVRALAGKRSGLLLPNGAAWLVALAASDGRGAVVLDHDADADSLATQLSRYALGAVFTTTELAHRLPAHVPRVHLDEAPSRARVITHDRDNTIDLGAHFGLELVGDNQTEGSPEECLIDAASGQVFSHAELLHAATRAMATHRYTPVDRTLVMSPLAHPSLLLHGLVAPLLAAGIVHAPHQSTAQDIRAWIERDDVTIAVGDRTAFSLLSNALRDSGPLHHSAVKNAVCTSAARQSLAVPASTLDELLAALALFAEHQAEATSTRDADSAASPRMD